MAKQKDLTHLCVQWKRVKSHRADESDVRGLGVEDVVLRGDPEAGVLGQNLHDFESLEIVDENVGQPKLVDQLQVHRDQSVRRTLVQFLPKKKKKVRTN